MTAHARSPGGPGQRERLLTVAQVRAQGDRADVLFFETARIYRLPKSHPDFDAAVRLLRAAAGAGTPVRIRFVEVNGDVIESVHAGGPPA